MKLLVAYMCWFYLISILFNSLYSCIEHSFTLLILTLCHINVSYIYIIFIILYLYILYLYLSIYIYKYVYIYIYIYTNLPMDTIVRLPHPRSGDRQEIIDRSGNVFSTLWWHANPQLWPRVLKPPSVPINPKAKGIEP